MSDRVLQLLDEHLNVMQQLKELIPDIEMAATTILHALEKGGKIFWMGNGGSAADAQHMAAELIGRYKLERRAIPSIALTTDTSILTCLSNDYDYSVIFSRQLEALCQPNDVVIGITTSGNSENILKGIKVAKQKGAYTIGLTGHQGGSLKTSVNLCLIVPSTTTARIQEGHIFIGHTLCELIENTIAQTHTVHDSELVSA